MTPENAKTWSRIIRDLITYMLGVFILMYELLSVPNPSVYWIGTGITLLGIPPVLRITQKDNGNGK